MNDDIMPLDPLPSKFRAFNWNVPDTVYDGRDIESIRESFGWLDSQKNGPNVIIYKTVKGKGVSFMENRHIWHGSPIKDSHLAEALPELETELSKKSGFTGRQQMEKACVKFSGRLWLIPKRSERRMGGNQLVGSISERVPGSQG
jgi:transketolase